MKVLTYIWSVYLITFKVKITNIKEDTFSNVEGDMDLKGHDARDII